MRKRQPRRWTASVFRMLPSCKEALACSLPLLLIAQSTSAQSVASVGERAEERAFSGLLVLAVVQLVVIAALLINAFSRRRKGPLLNEGAPRNEPPPALRASVPLHLRKRAQDFPHLNRAAAIGGLSGALAHELNQPLTAILSNSQAGQQLLRRSKIDQEELNAIMFDIEHDARRAGEVIGHVRDLLQRRDDHYEIVRVKSVVDDVLDLMHSDLVRRNVRVEVGPLESLPAMRADRVQLQQVLINLLSNAVDAMSGVDPGSRVIAISAVTRKRRVMLTVADSGCGITTEKPDVIFEPFLTTKHDGLGLGLAICRSIAEAHGGRIWGENAPSGGAAFHLELPSTSGARIA
jgi:C4-dicarboxylate-specific signal transduction histidine kinase